MIMYKIILLLQNNNLILGTVPKIQLCPVHLGPSCIHKKYIKSSVRNPEGRPLEIIKTNLKETWYGSVD
jgi:hypothetical protein